MRAQRFLGLLGIIGPLVMISFTLAAMALKPDFSWTEDSLSSIAGQEGETPAWSATGPPAIIFNMGCMFAGILLIVFSYGLGRSHDMGKGLGRVGAALFVFTGILLFLVGIFPNPVGRIHDVVSYSLFLLNPVAIMVMGLHLVLTKKGDLGKLSLVLGVLALLPFFLPRPWNGLAIPEMSAILPTTMFIIIFAYRLHQGIGGPAIKHEDGTSGDSEE